jgi:hypothetical protein
MSCDLTLPRDDHSAPSVFRPENMLRESRRQKGLRSGAVPAVCMLDPDGDIVDYVRKQFGSTRSPHWACYHTRLWEWERDGVRYGIVGYAVGGAFSVLVAEQLFASGCRLLVNVSSAGQISDVGPPPYYILADRALGDEGTSYHYLPPAAFTDADPSLIALAQAAFARSGCRVHTGSTWTTDAPFRETAESIALRRLGCVEGDFEKGDGNGVCGSAELVTRLASAWLQAARAGTPGPETAAAE